MKAMVRNIALLAAMLIPVSSVSALEPHTNEMEQQNIYVDTAYADYQEYLDRYQQASYDVPVISLDLMQYTTSDLDTAKPVQESDTSALYTGSAGVVTWEFEAEQAGFYQLEITYMPASDTDGTIQREILLDGNLPFSYAGNILFERTFAIIYPSEENSKDIFGNQLRPDTVVKNTWQTKRITDASGQLNHNMYFYLDAGKHTLSFRAVEQPMLLKKIQFVCGNDPAENMNDRSTGKERKIHIEAERPDLISDLSISVNHDLSSPNTVPYDPALVRYNVLGGEQWSSPGQWVEWTVDVPETGNYKLAIRYRQKEKTNSISYRRLFVDGKIPFEEAAAIPFSYKNSWQVTSLKNASIYLEQGTHTIRMEAVTGPYQSILNDADICVRMMNNIYSDIVMVTGPSPDLYRDYQLDKMLPETMEEMLAVEERLKDIISQIDLMTNNQSGQSTALINRLIDQIDKMVRKPSTIAESLTDFQSNIINVAAWVNSEREQPLELDYFEFLPVDADLPQAEAGFFSILLHNLKQFIASFAMDYNNIGALSTTTDKNITVWMNSGLDQLLVLRQIVNDEFISKFGINVTLQQVAANTLVPATMAGIGPDVALQRAQNEPMNFAYRKAICDLSQFAEIEEIIKWFPEGSLAPFEYDGHIYALPETLVYQMMFYRKDILDKIGIGEEQLDTWESILQGVIPTMQKSHLEFGLGSTFTNYAMLLYQYGGSVYNSEGTEVLFNDQNGIAALEMFCSLYSDYKLPLTFDFYNRFRSGQMPIAVVDSSFYNQLSVFAPELNGLWGIRCVPGIERNGEINRTVTATVTGSVIMNSSKDKNSAWQFLKWWLSAQTQEQYGNDLEIVLGSAARYASANLEVIDKINWSKDFKLALIQQREELKAVPEVPGGYFTSRNFDFAFRDIVYDGKDLREVISSSVQTTNREIASKREEFGLN